MEWHPHVTVATVVEMNGRFLLVYENAENGDVYNQPAGHLDPGESLVQAAIRETLEETGWHVEIESLLAVNVLEAPANKQTYVRISFRAKAIRQEPNAILDSAIIEACWLTYDEILANRSKLRSPLVLSDIDRYRSGLVAPLDLLTYLPLQ